MQGKEGSVRHRRLLCDLDLAAVWGPAIIFSLASKFHEEEDEVEEKQTEAGENRQERVLTGNDVNASARGRSLGRNERSQKAPDDEESDHRSDLEVGPIPEETPPGVSTRVLIGWPLRGRVQNRHGSALFMPCRTIHTDVG